MNTARAAIVGLIVLAVALPSPAAAQVPRGAQTIFGPDERAPVGNATTYPYTAIVYVESYQDTLHLGARETCSGTLIGPALVLTAAHCVYNKYAFGGWPAQTRVWADRNGSFQPYGAQYGTGSVPSGWINNSVATVSQPTAAQFYDFAVIVLPDATLGTAAGWLRVGALGDGAIRAAPMVIAGYDGDKPLGTMWVRGGAVEPAGWQLLYTLDSKAGSSGASVWRADDQVIVGVNTYESSIANLGRRIDADVLGFLSAVCQQQGCTFGLYTEPAATATPTAAPSLTPTPVPTSSPTPTRSPTPIATATSVPTLPPAATATATLVPPTATTGPTATPTPFRPAGGRFRVLVPAAIR